MRNILKNITAQGLGQIGQIENDGVAGGPFVIISFGYNVLNKHTCRKEEGRLSDCCGRLNAANGSLTRWHDKIYVLINSHPLPVSRERWTLK
jgi:hypothetical protein